MVLLLVCGPVWRVAWQDLCCTRENITANARVGLARWCWDLELSLFTFLLYFSRFEWKDPVGAQSSPTDGGI